MTRETTASRARGAMGLVSMAIGAGMLTFALAAPAGAHEGKEPDKSLGPDNLSCAELAERYGVEGEWIQSKIEAGDLPGEGGSQTYVLSDRGTPGDEADDAIVTITMVIEDKVFDWEANVGIDGVFVKGGSGGSWFYGYQPDVDEQGNVSGPGEEATQGVDHGTPPYHDKWKNQISHITFCWDDEYTPPTTEDTTPPSTEDTTPPSTEDTTPPSTEDTTPPSPTPTEENNPGESTATTIEVAGNPGESSSTTSTVAVEVASNSDALPRTGSSNSTILLVALGGVLVLGGGALLATMRIRRPGA
ncbi:MAG TPA: LPXTG cell wall anchor domain-containing protein [Acidimicrobiales bacterium]|nr:LPXTG cell wall anchor domain-containing protein [Acidimicrobiales bacterium]